MNAEETGWTKENLQKLYAAMKSSIPKPYRMCTYKKALNHVDWNKVAFPPFSPKACQKQWNNILQKMRKFRSLVEIIVEAEEVLSGPAQNNEAPYEEKHQLAMNEYRTRVLEFRNQDHTSPDHRNSQKRKRGSADTPDDKQHTEGSEALPPKPPVNGYNLFCKEQMASMAGVSKKDYLKVWAQRWRKLTETQKNKYSVRCRELKRQYSIELNKYLKTLDEEEQERILNKSGIKRPKECKGVSRQVKLVMTLPGEPKMPPRSGNLVFCKTQMQVLRDKFPNAKERFIEVNRRWQELSTKKKECYKAKMRKNLRRYSITLQKWFKTLTAAEQKEYVTNNPSKLQYLNSKQLEVYDSEEHDSEEHDSEEHDRELRPSRPSQDKQHTEGSEDLPHKPPYNGYDLFCKEQMASMAGVSKKDYIYVWAQRWRDLTETQKNEYSVRCREVKRQYSIELKKYLKTLTTAEQKEYLTRNPKKRQYLNNKQLKVCDSEEHDSEEHDSEEHDRELRPSRPSDKQHTESSELLSRKPPINGFNLFCKEQMASMAGVSKKDYIYVWAQRWRDLTETQKNEYSVRCRELKRQYSIELNKYLKTLTTAEQKEYLTRNPKKLQYLNNKQLEVCDSEEHDSEEHDSEEHDGELRPSRPSDKQHNEGSEALPHKPPYNSYDLFCKEQMASVAFVSKKDYNYVCSQRWRDLTETQKNEYSVRCRELKRQFSIELNKYLKTLTAAQQKEYLTNNPNRRHYLNSKQLEVCDSEEHDRELRPSRPSDSEDEDLEDSSSDEEQYDVDSDEDEEEEEEGDITFDMY